MEITNVNFYPYDGKSNLKAFASVCFDDAIVVRTLKLQKERKGFLFRFLRRKVQMVITTTASTR